MVWANLALKLRRMTAKLTFLGAAGSVTGSKYLLENDNRRILIDCGLFQGFKQLRLRNWAPFPVPPSSIDEVLLTHAHLDHSGYLPLFVREGFRGPVRSTDATRELCEIILRDSGRLQEKDAEFANRHGFSKHNPALPLYTEADAVAALARFQPVPFHQTIAVSGGWSAQFRYAGHILGASTIELTNGPLKILFSGDLGRSNDICMFEPEAVQAADYLLLESTYGNRKHDSIDPAEALAQAIFSTYEGGGTVVIPAFAVGRTQALLFYFYRLKRDKRIPDIPIYLDSPMAIDATEIFERHQQDHSISPDELRAALSMPHYVRTTEDSKKLNTTAGPKIIISASGMATGGRVLHHLELYAPDPRNLILFVGYQAAGTRGAAMMAGANTIKLHGRYIPLRAKVENLGMLSGHADADEIIAWLRNFRAAPKMTFLTHGEPEAADVLRRRIAEELGWPCTVPDYRDQVELP
jgi:metallo-beta-lactamase family protein